MFQWELLENEKKALEEYNKDNFARHLERNEKLCRTQKKEGNGERRN